MMVPTAVRAPDRRRKQTMPLAVLLDCAIGDSRLAAKASGDVSKIGMAPSAGYRGLV